MKRKDKLRLFIIQDSDMHSILGKNVADNVFEEDVAEALNSDEFDNVDSILGKVEMYLVKYKDYINCITAAKQYFIDENKLFKQIS